MSKRTKEKKSNRKSDFRKTEKVNPILDILYQEKGYSVDRIEDTDLQKNGVDVIVRKESEELFVEEKAAITAYDRDLATYAIELYSENNKASQGWFVNPNKKTSHYAFAYVRAYSENLSDIYHTEVLVVDAEKLKKYLKDHDVNFDCNNVKSIIEFFGERKDEKLSYINGRGIKYVQTLSVKEKPICVLVPRSELEKMSSFKMVYDYNDEAQAARLKEYIEKA
jgi:hypothetical protein